MATKQLTVERFSVVSARSFEDVLLGLEKGIGRPDMRVLHQRMDAAPTFAEFQKIIHGAVGVLI